MFDYYRVRFKEFSKPRQRPHYVLPPDVEPVSMPFALSTVAWLCCILAAVGVFLSNLVGKPAPGALRPIFAAIVALVPVAFTLAAGFSEQQAWTRPLLVIMLVASAFIAALFHGYAVAAGLCTVAAASAVYLYGSRSSRAYYSYLKQISLVHISPSDFRTATFLPLYTGAAGILVGIAIAAFLLTVPEGILMGGVYDAVAFVGAGVIGGSFFGYLGRLLGEALASRRARKSAA